MNFKSLLIILFVCFSGALNAQKYTISGTIKDAKNGEDLIGATVVVEETREAAAANQYGYYSLTTSKGQVTLLYSYIGYTVLKKKIDLKGDLRLNISLSEEAIQTQEVVVTDRRADANVSEMKMSKVEMNVAQLKKLPALFGEPDLIKLVQLQPGVVSAGEGTGAFFVRGGGADQNLILFDGAQVYDPTHLFGLIGAFNSSIVKTSDLYKGGIPSQYGGRLSSVLDIKSIDGNNKRTAGAVSLGILAFRANLQGPIWLKKRQRDSTGAKITPEEGSKMSYLISYRRSFVGYLLKLSPQTKNTDIYFQDLNFKINYNIDAKNRVFLSTYLGRDYLSVAAGSTNFNFNWGNTTGTLRWNHIFNNKLFSNTSLIASNFDYSLVLTNLFSWTSYIREITLKQDYEYVINPRNTVSFGISSAFRQFSPGVFQSLNANIPTIALQKMNAWDNAAYISHRFDVNTKLAFEYGVRLSVFSNIGPGKFYDYKDPSSNQKTDSVQYGNGQFIKTFVNPEPRASVRYKLGQTSSIKASYNRMVQNTNQINVGTVPLPINYWIPSTYYLKPQIADQIAIGYFRNFKDNMFEVSGEVFYKNMQNAVDFLDNTMALNNPDLPHYIRQGHGWSYGAELFIVKSKGKLTGQIGYTYSRTFRQIQDINGGNPYPSSFDRPNALNVLLTYELTPRLSVSAIFTYSTGRPITLPVGKYDIPNNSGIAGVSSGVLTVNEYTSRNGFRLPDYHRLDLSVVWKSKQKVNRKWNSETNFSIYNVYDRKNPFTVYVQTQTTDVKNTDGTISTGNAIPNTPNQEAVLIYLFPILPSISYTINF
jgi:hypothetical protein